jgi:hypothetical protein
VTVELGSGALALGLGRRAGAGAPRCSRGGWAGAGSACSSWAGVARSGRPRFVRPGSLGSICGRADGVNESFTSSDEVNDSFLSSGLTAQTATVDEPQPRGTSWPAGWLAGPVRLSCARSARSLGEVAEPGSVGSFARAAVTASVAPAAGCPQPGRDVEDQAPLAALPGFSSCLADTLERGRPPGKGGACRRPDRDGLRHPRRGYSAGVAGGGSHDRRGGEGRGRRPDGPSPGRAGRPTQRGRANAPAGRAGEAGKMTATNPGSR